MRFIEFAGLPGAGKSTIIRHLVSLEGSKGNSCITREEALWHSLINNCDDRLCRGLLRFLPRSYTKKKAHSIFCRSLDRLKCQHRFLAEHGRSLGAILDSEQFKIMSPQNRATVVGWFLGPAAVYQMISEQTDQDTIVIFDEGFVQRSMSLFVVPGHLNSEFSPAHAHHYYEAVPQPDLVVFIDVDPETCMSRMLSRPNSIPSRLRGMDDKSVRIFLQQTHEFFRDILSAKENIFSISNNESIETTVHKISNRLESLSTY